MKKLLKNRLYPTCSIVLSHIKEWGGIRIKLAGQNNSLSGNNFVKLFFWVVNSDTGFFRGTLSITEGRLWTHSSFAVIGATPFQLFLKLPWVKEMLASSKIFVGKRNKCICWSEIWWKVVSRLLFFVLHEESGQTVFSALYDKDAEKYGKEDAPV